MRWVQTGNRSISSRIWRIHPSLWSNYTSHNPPHFPQSLHLVAKLRYRWFSFTPQSVCGKLAHGKLARGKLVRGKLARASPKSCFLCSWLIYAKLVLALSPAFTLINPRHRFPASVATAKRR